MKNQSEAYIYTIWFDYFCRHILVGLIRLNVDVIKFAAFKAGGSGDWEEDRAIREFPKVDYT